MLKKYLITYALIPALFAPGCDLIGGKQQAPHAVNAVRADGAGIAAGRKSSPASIEGIDSVATDNYANAKLEFYYYIPEDAELDKQDTCRAIVCIPGLSGKGQHFVSPV